MNYATVHLFFYSLYNLPRLCVLCDTLPIRLSAEIPPKSPKFDVKQLEPILLRYISSPSRDSTFDIRFERTGINNFSSSLERLKLHSSAALWALAVGRLNVGRRIHLHCDGDIPKFVREPTSAPLGSSCHHLVGLSNWRILGVRETQVTIANAANHALKRSRWISIQVRIKSSSGGGNKQI